MNAQEKETELIRMAMSALGKRGKGACKTRTKEHYSAIGKRGAVIKAQKKTERLALLDKVMDQAGLKERKRK